MHYLRMCCALILAIMGLPAQAQTRLAFIDPLSGPFALTGELALRRLRDEVALRNALPTARNAWEVLALDNKGTVQESLIALRQAIDQDARVIIQGQSSAVAHALIEAIHRHNERDPARAVLLLNYAATDPALTEARCSFWHFRFDAHLGMRMEALTAHIARTPEVKRVYLIVQDYAFGHEFARAARALLALRRPDIQIVGEDRHALGQVRDFAPYIAKIRAAQADTVLTGNWGPDLNLLVKAARESSSALRFYTFYAGSPGAVSAMGEAAAGRVIDVTDWHINATTRAEQQRAEKFQARYGTDYHFARLHTLVQMLHAATLQAQSTHALPIALALENRRFMGETGEVQMRRFDHQLLMPLYIAELAKREGTQIASESSALAWRTLQTIPAYVATQPTSCQLNRPSRLQ